jgi:hypothetical protein
MLQVRSILTVAANATRWLGGMFRASATAANEGFEQLSIALQRMPDEFEAETVKAQEQSIANMKVDLKAYPAPRMTSTYIRTYVLRTGWDAAPISTTNTMDSGFPANVTSIENQVPYAGWVQLRATQTRWNRGRWATVEDVIAKHSPSVVDGIIRALTILARSF